MRAISLIPAFATGRMAVGALRAGAGWIRFRQWDAVATNLAIGSMLGAAALSLTQRALR